jgi:hypothetical protein
LFESSPRKKPRFDRMNGLSFFWRSPLKYIALCGVLMGTVLLGGCAQVPQPVPEPPLQYEDPAVPPPPVAYTDKIREVAVVETTGSRGGAALRAQEDLDVLANDHYEGVEPAVTDQNARQTFSTLPASVSTKNNGKAHLKDKSVYARKDKSVYAIKPRP